MPEGYNGLPPYYVESSDPTTVNLGLSLIGMDPIVAEDFVLIDSAFGSISGSIKINGSIVANPNFVDSASATFGVVGSNISITASGGGTPGGANGEVQGNNAGVFGGLPGSVIDFTNGTLSIAPTGTGVALSVTGDASSSNIQNWYVNGQSGASWGMAALPYGDTIGVQLSMVDSTGNTATLDPGASDGLKLSDTSGDQANLNVNNGLFVRDTSGSVQIQGTQSQYHGSSIFMQPASGAYNGSTSGVALIIVGSNTGDLSDWYTNSSVLAVTIDTMGNLSLPLAGIKDHTGSLGTSGQVLSSTGTQTLWATSISAPANVVLKTANYTAVANDFVKCDTSGGGFTVTLPLSAANFGKTITVKKISNDTNVLTIARSGADSIDGQATQVTAIPNTAVETLADGLATWEIY